MSGYLYYYIFLIINLIFSQNVRAMDDYLDIAKPYKAEFSVSKKVDKTDTFTKAVFKGEGFQQLEPGDSLKVNGKEMMGHPIFKDGIFGKFQIGYSYQLDIPDAEHYEFVWARKADHSEVKYIITPIAFSPSFPDTISVNKDLVIPLNGLELPVAIEIMARLGSSLETPPEKRWELVFDMVSKGNALYSPSNELLHPKRSWQKLHLGKCELDIGVFSKRYERQGQDKLVFAISKSGKVFVNN